MTVAMSATITHQAPPRRVLSGTVVSALQAKTVVVRVDTLKLHPKYGRKYRVSKKYHVHNPGAEAQVGQTVAFVECRPLSKTKRWRLLNVSSN